MLERMSTAASPCHSSGSTPFGTCTNFSAPCRAHACNDLPAAESHDPSARRKRIALPRALSNTNGAAARYRRARSVSAATGLHFEDEPGARTARHQPCRADSSGYVDERADDARPKLVNEHARQARQPSDEFAILTTPARLSLVGRSLHPDVLDPSTRPGAPAETPVPSPEMQNEAATIVTLCLWNHSRRDRTAGAPSPRRPRNDDEQDIHAVPQRFTCARLRCRHRTG